MTEQQISDKAKELIDKFGKEAALEKVDAMIRLAIDFDYEEEVSHYHKIKSVIEQDYHNYLNSIK